MIERNVKLRRRLRIRQQICSPKSTHFFEIPLVPGQYIHKHSGNAKIFDFFGTVRKLGPKNQKRVNFRSFFPKFQMWIVLFWLNLHDWSFQGCYKALWNTNFEPLKFAKFDHQVALRPLFTFSFLAVLAMFLTVLSRFFFMMSTSFIRCNCFWNEILGATVCLPVNDVFLNKPFVTFGLWALEALFVAEKSIVVNENDRKIIEEDSSFHLTYQTLISDDWCLRYRSNL